MAEAHVFSTNLNLTSHPTTDWRFGARYRNYTYSNQMPATRITNIRQLRRLGRRRRRRAVRISTPTAGPTSTPTRPGRKLKPLALTVGYTHNGNGYDARIFESSGEDVFRVSADAVGSS